ncbi:MAG: cell wall metabolism sensor histidine kinase WalK [Clostridiales bacterium]|nr:cell wall metabolism sensor histidine kinase WalK [Clostridiales bacterium]
MRIHILLLIITAGLIPVLVSTFLLLNEYENKAMDKRLNELQNQGDLLSKLILPSGYLSGAQDNTINGEIERISEIFHGRILIVNSSLNIIKDTYGLEEGKYLISENVIQTFQGKSSKRKDSKNDLIFVTNPIVHNISKEIMGVIVMNFSTKDIQTMRDSLEKKAILSFATLTILIMVCAVYFSRKLTKPLTSIVYSIDHLTEGYMDEGVSIKGFYEIEKISDSFNHLIGRMQKLERSRQEFVSNVSHELKTPITSIKVLADSLLMQEDTPVELYREFLVDIAEEIERENKIINDLLSLVKLDKTAGDMNISIVNINELLEQLLKRLGPIAKKKNVEIIYESFRPVIAEVDEVKLSLAITNLVENAIKYNVDDGWIRVSLNADHKYFFVKVSDSGIGIPEDALDNIFDRFYRVDKARSRESGGTGLGLSITKNVIQMHRGAIKVYSNEGEGTTFNVRIPLNYIA